MDIEAGAAAGAGRAAGQRRIGIGDVDDTREVADQRLQRVAQLGESVRQVARQRGARIVDRSDHADAPEQFAFGRRVDDDVGDQSGEIDVVGADRQQHEVELAVGLPAFRRGERVAQFGHLRVDGALAGRPDFAGGHSRARCGPNRPSAMVAPVQASGR